MHIVTSKTMAEQTCTPRFLNYWIKLVSHRRSLFLGFCVLNFVFSLVGILGNLLAIRALMKTSTIPATVKKMFLSLAFADLAVRLRSQLMTASISAVMLKMASSGDDLAFFCPTVLIVDLYFLYLLATASSLSVIIITLDRLLAVSLHLRYQEIVTQNPQIDSVFQPFKFIPKITLNFYLHSTCNINSKALLRATADGRCEKLLINRGDN